jgi:hypothetical protein
MIHEHANLPGEPEMSHPLLSHVIECNIRTIILLFVLSSLLYSAFLTIGFPGAALTRYPALASAVSNIDVGSSFSYSMALLRCSPLFSRE